MHGNANQATSKIAVCTQSQTEPIDLSSHKKLCYTEKQNNHFEEPKLKASLPLEEIKAPAKNNLLFGQLPTRIIAACVDNSSYNETMTNGTIASFNFKNNNVNFICLSRDRVQIPHKALQPEFENGGFIRSYTSLFTQTG